MREAKTFLPDYKFTSSDAKWLLKQAKLLQIKKQALPMQTGVIFNVKGNGMTVRISDMVTDLKLTYDEKLSANMPDVFWVTLDVLEHYAKSSDATWEFEPGTVKIDGVKFNILDGKDFFEDRKLMELGGTYFLYASDVRRHTIACCSGGEESDPKSGIRIEREALISTNGKQALFTKRLSHLNLHPDITVPVNFLKLYSEISGPTYFTTHEDFFIRFESKNVVVKSRQIIGDYPDVQAIVKTYTNTLKISVAELSKVKKLESVYKNNSSNEIQFNFEPIGITVSSDSFSPEMFGEIKISGLYMGDFITISVDSDLLLHVLKLAEGELFVSFGDPEQPLVMVDRSNQWQYLLMPLRKGAKKPEEKSGNSENTVTFSTAASSVTIPVDKFSSICNKLAPQTEVKNIFSEE